MPPSTLFLKHGTNLSGNKLTIDFIDVGQGNCVLVGFPNGKYMLVDCGSQTTSLNGAPFRHVESYVQSVVGDEGIDCVVLSHGDDDHTAFVPYIDQAATPTYLHFGGRIGDYSNAVQNYIGAQENQRNRFVFRYPADYSAPQADADFASDTYDGEAHVMVLAASYGQTPNTQSIVLLIRFRSHVIILPGDAETDTEAFILANVPKKLLARCAVLMPGHHGAHESTSTAWADQLKPDIGAISASGTNLSYAHPACSTNRLLQGWTLPGAIDHEITCSEGRGIRYGRSDTDDALLVTATNGDIRFVSDGSNWRLMASSVRGVADPYPPPDPRLGAMVANAPWNRRPAVPVKLEPDPGQLV